MFNIFNTFKYFRICNLKLYKLVDDLSLLDSLLQSFGPRYLSECLP